MAPPSIVIYINSIIVNNILYSICYDILNIANNGAINHNEMNHHGDSRALQRIKNAANQRKRHQDPARREAE
jgi:hypothetical protein